MGILDITDQFCKPIQAQDKKNLSNCTCQSGNKLHEQPIVTFVEKDNIENVVYREEL